MDTRGLEQDQAQPSHRPKAEMEQDPEVPPPSPRHSMDQTADPSGKNAAPFRCHSANSGSQLNVVCRSHGLQESWTARTVSIPKAVNTLTRPREFQNPTCGEVTKGP